MNPLTDISSLPPVSLLYEDDEEEGISTIETRMYTVTVSARPSLDSSLNQQSDAASEHLLPSFLYQAVVRIEGFGELRKNWDSYDADPISSEARKAAIQVIQNVHECLSESIREDSKPEDIKPYAAVPLSDGGVQLEWRGARSEIEVEIGPDGELAYLLVQGHGSSREFFEAERVSMREVMVQIGQVLVA